MNIELTKEEAQSIYWMATARAVNPVLPENLRVMYANISNKLKKVNEVTEGPDPVQI